MLNGKILTASKTIQKEFQIKNLELNKVVLFGSFAKKSQTKVSDIDILIVSRNFRKKSLDNRINMILGLSRKLVEVLDIPVDLLLYSDEEWKNSFSLILNEAKRDGKLIYP
jgi:predicted nucleotidyltransferase